MISSSYLVNFRSVIWKITHANKHRSNHLRYAYMFGINCLSYSHDCFLFNHLYYPPIIVSLYLNLFIID